jgi:hypothetical protein
MMPGKLACMRLRSGRHMKPGREKRIYKRAQRARERREALTTGRYFTKRKIT